MDVEKTKGRIWNGYVCPGCRTVFRVAADFIGTDVICPSCKETLRLPKTPEEARSNHTDAETPTASAVAAIPAKRAKLAKLSNPGKPARPPDLAQVKKPSVRHAMPSGTSRRLKLTLALLLPLTVIVSVLLLFPSNESTPDEAVLENTPLDHPDPPALRKPAPLPPPIAVSEMPIPAPPTMPETVETPVPEFAFVQPVPEPVNELVENTPEVPEPVAAVDTSEPGLVEAIPATPVPAPENPAPPLVPPPAAQPEPEATAVPAELVHTVARGDTLGRIARKYRVEARAIMQANGMKNDVVRLGRKLVIPAAP